ncbi:DUF4194 domain-containing protein [Luteimonas sp. SJ-92]|uniref:DUF4194 domain-containing protein n=1 Tax=Luteimonas salinisoli TaxID=2752307 RepID=A0A853JCP8_9GAMM|nr:DUF4194 domain-containing protein [Luteimonas salinisoli]NZA26399.1 DUF4194 domain-containing protein [Luteimonas salinisoli]
MKRSWNTLSQSSNGMYSVQDFERAAYRLVTEQVLYAADRGSKVAYHLVEAHLEDFATALQPLGIRLQRNAQHRYLVALPAHAEGTPVTLEETLLLLVLRQRYDEAFRQGRIEEHGEVVAELPELQEAYQALAGRAMPEVGALRQLARALRRWGVCRLVESEGDDPQPFHLLVRPAIVEIVGEQWLQRLDQHNADDADDGDDATAEDDDAAA